MRLLGRLLNGQMVVKITNPLTMPYLLPFCHTFAGDLPAIPTDMPGVLPILIVTVESMKVSGISHLRYTGGGVIFQGWISKVIYP